MRILTGIGLVIGVATLDLVAFMFAKEWAAGRGPWLFWIGLAINTGLFGLYAASLGLLDPLVVSFGWIAAFQLGLVLLNRFHYGVAIGAGRVSAIAAMMVLEAYLILGGAPNT